MTVSLRPGSAAARATLQVMSGRPAVTIDDGAGDPLPDACATVAALLAHRPHLEVVFLADDRVRAARLLAQVVCLVGDIDPSIRVTSRPDGPHPNPRPTIKVVRPEDLTGKLRTALLVVDSCSLRSLDTFRVIEFVRQVLFAGAGNGMPEIYSGDGGPGDMWEPIPTEVLLAGAP